MTLALVVTEKKSHAHFAPSKAHRWLPCPGSMQFLGQDPETEWAAEGTRKHAVLEMVLSPQNAVTKNGALVLAGDTIETEAGPYKVPLEVLEQCYEIRDFIEQFKQVDAGGWVVETETKVEIGSHYWPGMKPGDCDGTADAAAYSYEELLVLDAKFGFVQVEARGNPQLMLYAAGLLAEIPFPIKWVTLCIAQPGYDGLVLFREHRVTVEEIHDWMFQQQHVVEEIQRGSRRLHADDHACRYCPARTDCPARLQALHDAADDEWMAARPIEELLPYVSRLRAICRDIEQRAMAELNVGKPVRGWKLVAAKSRRKWPEEEEGKVVEGLAGALGYEKPPEEFYERALKSPAQMEKTVRAIANAAPGQKMTVKQAKNIVDTFAFQPQGGPKLVPESDPRPALEAATWTLEDVLAASLEAGDGD